MKLFSTKGISTMLTTALALSVAIGPLTSARAEEGTLPGARSEYNATTGDVFLGGNYIEVGVSKGGSFGTQVAPTDASFHRDMAYKGLGLVSDGDGWNIGNAPTTGDFFLPGTPEERWVLTYQIGATTYNYPLADRNGAAWPGTAIQQPTTVDASDTSKDLLKAVTTGITAENVKVELTYSFGVNDSYYDTQVVVTNQGSAAVENVRFMRSFDPDQDYKPTNNYETYNKVICNPVSDVAGSTSNFAMVVARGNTTLDGMFFIAFDNRARVSHGVAFAPTSAYIDGLWTETTEGLPTQAAEEAIALTQEQLAAADLNGYSLEDSAIAITFNLQSIAASASTSFNYYSSLDPDVESSLDDIRNSLDINSILASIKDLTELNVKSMDKATIERVDAALKALDTTDATEEELAALQAGLDKCEDLLDVLGRVKVEVTKADEAVSGLTKETVTEDDRDDINTALAAYKALLKDHTGNLTAAEISAVKDAIANCNALLKKLHVFIDVPANAWFAANVDFCFQNDFMAGTSADKFSPTVGTTRAMFVTILWRMEGKPAANTSCTFTDVTAGAYYDVAVDWAAEKGIVVGFSAETFRPDRVVTREQMAAIMQRYARFKGADITARDDLSTFKDAGKVSNWAKPAVQWVIAEKLMVGSNGTFAPVNDTRRSEVAAVVQRISERFSVSDAT